MKTTAIALATVLALTGATFAKDASDKGQPAPTAQQTDTLTTSSIKQSSHNVSVPTNGDFASQKGIDVNPNFLPHF